MWKSSGINYLITQVFYLPGKSCYFRILTQGAQKAPFSFAYCSFRGYAAYFANFYCRFFIKDINFIQNIVSMKRCLFISSICILVSFSTSSQITYLADTAFTTDVGYGGAPASCRAEHCLYFGWNMNRATSQWSADVFSIPPDSTWKFDTVIVYGVQKNSGTVSTFLNCNLQIYDGTPGLGGSVIWGDTSTNVLSSAGFTGIYKVDTLTSHEGLLNTANPIMYLKLYLSPAPVLSSGTYWLAWSAAGSGSGEIFTPDKVLPGRINPSGQMGRGQYNGIWQYDTDSSNTAGFNKIVKASAGLASVPNITNNPLITLSQNTPNPFNTSTNISFHLPQPGYVRLAVYNTIGRSVATLVDGSTNAGDHTVTFDAPDIPPGVYYYQLSTDEAVSSKPMLIIR